jgi:predicted lipid-binding transport protein (Tim44 family)
VEEDEEQDDSPLAAGITQIKLADRDFDPKGFVAGARSAFEMIIGAFAEGDIKTLRPLLANDVYDDFSGAIKAREEKKEVLETTLIGITSAERIEAEMQQKTAFVTVKFVSEQVNVTRDAENRIVDGDPNHVTKVTDIWTFARNTRSRDPNWALVATRSPN